MARQHPLDIVSELVANVLSIECAVGDRVEAGQTVVLLESMKMEIPVLAPVAGTVSAIHVAPDKAFVPLPRNGVVLSPWDVSRGRSPLPLSRPTRP